MTHAELNRAVERATGESITEVTVKLRDAYDDFVALQSDFDDFDRDTTEKTFSIVVGPIDLDNVMLGDFRVVLHWDQLGSSKPYEVFGLQPALLRGVFPRWLLRILTKRSGRGDGSGDGIRRLRELVDEFSTQLDVPTCFHRANPDHECFVKHFCRQASEFFTLLRQANVEATNYRAEQAIRPSVVNREVWDGNPTDNGTHGQSILTSVLVTCDQLLRNPLEFLAQSLRTTQTIP